MKVIAKIHKVDNDIVEIFSLDKKYLMGVWHIDLIDKAISKRLEDGIELKLTMEIEE